MLELIVPTIKQLDYRKKLLADSKTMAFFEGPIDFKKEIWPAWYKQWTENNNYYYAYIYDHELDCFIGEVSYQYEEEYRGHVLNIILEYKYRGLGKGKEALELLCKKAKENGLRFLYDDMDISNPSRALFLSLGFKEAWQKENIVMLRKRL